MCSPNVIRHVMASLGPADRPGGHGPEPPRRSARSFSQVFDLTHPLPETFPSASGDQWLRTEDFMTFGETGINFKIWHVHEHVGTHIDAPIHFSADGCTTEQIPVHDLVVPLAIIDISERADGNADTEMTPRDIRDWQAKNGPLPRGCCVAVNSGWDRFATDERFRNADDEGRMHYPGVHPEAAQMLLEDSEVVGLAIDTLSFDHGPSTDYPAHKVWLPAGRWAIECLANLSRLPAVGATIVVGAPTVVGSTGGPSRVVALV